MTRFLLTLALLLAAAAASAQSQPAERAFVNAPRSVFPLVDRNTRLDMLDYYHANLSTSSPNALEGSSRVVDAGPMQVTARMSDASTVQLALLPAAPADTLRLVVTTVATPVLDSRIQFYDASWKAVAADSRFKAPELVEWLADKSRLRDVEAVLPFMLVSYSYNPATATLTLVNNTAEFLGDDQWRQIGRWMRSELTYTWNGRKFTLSGAR